jgi:hypothetical protein
MQAWIYSEIFGATVIFSVFVNLISWKLNTSLRSVAPQSLRYYSRLRSLHTYLCYRLFQEVKKVEVKLPAFYTSGQIELRCPNVNKLDVRNLTPQYV